MSYSYIVTSQSPPKNPCFKMCHCDGDLVGTLVGVTNFQEKPKT
uniref:Uncharacterized protein n=1 Tax=Arundo donax TaxID=35708 RepID=A0A0A9CCP1_ARUDO